jgi:hypothetical protein
MRGVEDEHLELKEARNQYIVGKLIKYCSELNNERGGKMVLGATEKKPRRVVVGCADWQGLYGCYVFATVGRGDRVI